MSIDKSCKYFDEAINQIENARSINAELRQALTESENYIGDLETKIDKLEEQLENANSRIIELESTI